jgi:hypothetical protein
MTLSVSELKKEKMKYIPPRGDRNFKMETFG